MRTWAVAVVAGFVGFATQAPAQDGDATRGQRVFNQQCRACHTLDKGGASTAGPNLRGVFGRKAGTAEGFEFSDAMKKSGIVWDDKTMAEYLKDPKGRVPDGKMVYAGLKQQAQLDDMIAYLKKAAQ